MNTQLISNFKHISTRIPAVLLVLSLALLVTACSSPTRASQPAGQTGATDHPPVILRVEERQTTKDGKLAYYRDVYYSDAAGDAEIVKFSCSQGNCWQVKIFLKAVPSRIQSISKPFSISNGYVIRSKPLCWRCRSSTRRAIRVNP